MIWTSAQVTAWADYAGVFASTVKANMASGAGPEGIKEDMRYYIEGVSSGNGANDGHGRDVVTKYETYWDMLVDDALAYGNDTDQYRSMAYLQASVVPICAGVLDNPEGLLAGRSG